MCVIQLRRSLAPTGDASTEEVVTATKQAQDILDREMSKPGSASSRSSCPELTTSNSTDVLRPTSANGETAMPLPGADNLDEGDGAVGGANSSEQPCEEEKVFTLCVLHAGMDTEGEVFDDLLVVNLEH